MATASRPSDPDVTKTPLEERFRNEPHLFEFFQAVRLLERFLPDRVEVGKFAPPSSEVVRFKANSTLVFPASEIQSMTWPAKGPVEMMVNFMGLTGPQGVLPTRLHRLRGGKGAGGGYRGRRFLRHLQPPDHFAFLSGLGKIPLLDRLRTRSTRRLFAPCAWT